MYWCNTIKYLALGGVHLPSYCRIRGNQGAEVLAVPPDSLRRLEGLGDRPLGNDSDSRETGSRGHVQGPPGFPPRHICPNVIG